MKEMKIMKLLYPSCFVFLLAGATLCQDLGSLPVAGETQLTIDASGNRLDSRSRQGALIWDNMAQTSWFSSMTARYIWLDWGELADQGNGLPDEVIDGFSFAYGSEYSYVSISWAVYFCDSCTGWGDMSLIQEAAFVFSGLPAGGSGSGYWGWVVSVDLTDSGEEFLLGNKIGIGQSLLTPDLICGPKITRPPNVGGNGPTGTENSFDIRFPNGNHKGTYWFGSYPAHPWASFRFELYGASDPALRTTYAGIGLQGNDAALYTLGEWAAGESVQFLLRKNKMVQDGWLATNTAYYSTPVYLPNFDITLVPRIPFLAMVRMTPDPDGDFDRYTFDVGSTGANLRFYIQGGITDFFSGGPLAPVDLSNVVFTN